MQWTLYTSSSSDHHKPWVAFPTACALSQSGCVCPSLTSSRGVGTPPLPSFFEHFVFCSNKFFLLLYSVALCNCSVDIIIILLNCYKHSCMCHWVDISTHSFLLDAFLEIETLYHTMGRYLILIMFPR